jgi:hypothetical protein
MPIDPSIVLGVRPVQIPQADPIEQFSKSMALKGLLNQNQIQNQAITDDQATRDAYQQAGGDNARLRSLLVQGGQYKGVQALDKFDLDQRAKSAEIGKNEAAAKKSQYEVAIGQVQHGASILSAVTDQASYDAARRSIALNIDPKLAEQMPPEYDPAFVKSKIDAGLTVVQKLQDERARATEAEAKRHNTATEGNAAATLKETTRHHGAIEGDPAEIEQTAQAIAKGQLAPLSGFALARPAAQKVMARVVEINPDFDPTQFATRQKAEKDFATGKAGNSVRSFNVALSHLDTLDQLATALNNKDTQIINKVGNAYATQTGASAPTNFEAAKKIVADEIVKAIVGSGGGVADREEAAKTIQAANSPAQLKGVINTYKELMRGQINGLRDQYKATTGKEDFDTKYLSESGRKAAHGAEAPKPKTGVDPKKLSDAEIKRELGL